LLIHRKTSGIFVDPAVADVAGLIAALPRPLFLVLSPILPAAVIGPGTAGVDGAFLPRRPRRLDVSDLRHRIFLVPTIVPTAA
jgi:hypothetical protein